MSIYTIFGNVCKELTIKGITIPDYFVAEDGNIWSTKRGLPTMKKPTITATNSGTNGYAKSGLKYFGDTINIFFHRVAAEAWVPFTKPKEIPKKDWDATPESVKRHMQNLYFVNHIDHDRSNFHPSNLEWVTSEENAKAYQKHSKGK